MKLSTRIKREVREDFLHLPIVIMVDCKMEYLAKSMEEADAIHKNLVESGCTLLPEECPVVNGYEIVIHYTSTTYAKWCEKLSLLAMFGMRRREHG